MIRFEINDLPFAITNDQLNTITRLIKQYGWHLDYDVVENYMLTDGTPESIILLWIHHEEGNPTRHHILMDGTIELVEEVDWDWKGLTS